MHCSKVYVSMNVDTRELDIVVLKAERFKKQAYLVVPYSDKCRARKA
jgi:hypothetical protein